VNARVLYELNSIDVRIVIDFAVNTLHQAEASTVYRVITLASQANAPICITKITGKMTADVVARSRRQGLFF